MIMLKVDATIMCFADSVQDRASYHYRGKREHVIALLASAGIDDLDFGEIIIHAGLKIAEDMEKQEEQQTAEAN